MKKYETSLRAVIEKEADGSFTGYVLEFDIVTTGKSLDETKTNIVECCVAYLDYALEKNLIDKMFKPAPAEIWNKYFFCKMLQGKLATLPDKTPRGHTVPDGVRNLIIHDCKANQTPSHCVL
jgi:predicted RNase H-like HicB family nuclease